MGLSIGLHWKITMHYPRFSFIPKLGKSFPKTRVCFYFCHHHFCTLRFCNITHFLPSSHLWNAQDLTQPHLIVPSPRTPWRKHNGPFTIALCIIFTVFLNLLTEMKTLMSVRWSDAVNIAAVLSILQTRNPLGRFMEENLLDAMFSLHK